MPFFTKKDKRNGSGSWLSILIIKHETIFSQCEFLECYLKHLIEEYWDATSPTNPNPLNQQIQQKVSATLFKGE